MAVLRAKDAGWCAELHGGLAVALGGKTQTGATRAMSGLSPPVLRKRAKKNRATVVDNIARCNIRSVSYVGYFKHFRNKNYGLCYYLIT